MPERKLHILVYYALVCALSILNIRLFDGVVLAGAAGPLILGLTAQPQNKASPAGLSPEVESLLQSILKVQGSLPLPVLVEQVKEERPWLEARSAMRSPRINPVIPFKALEAQYASKSQRDRVASPALATKFIEPGRVSDPAATDTLILATELLARLKQLPAEAEQIALFRLYAEKIGFQPVAKLGTCLISSEVEPVYALMPLPGFEAVDSGALLFALPGTDSRTAVKPEQNTATG